MVEKLIPIVLFAYSRPDHLRRTLACLRENNVPLIYAFSDAPKSLEVAERVNEVRQILHEIDWCEVHLVEREENRGLGTSILTGVSEVFQKHDTIIVFEDDITCVPGTYGYLCAALEHYKDYPKVMSVTGWTHPLSTPGDISNQPYFDGRIESWSWGTWARAWRGMEQDAKALVNTCIEKNIDVYRYGADLLEMANIEKEKNIWAVRFAFLHIIQGGLCLRPPWSMAEHIGFDSNGTNAKEAGIWAASPLKPCPQIPAKWPEPVEHIECARLWQQTCGTRPTVFEHIYRFARRMISKALRAVSLM